jgi:ABC-type Fe3+ transport system permease subunit
LTYRELTLPVLLSTNDNLPLAVVVWNFWLGSLYGPSAATAVLMLVIMMPIVFAAWWLALRRDVSLSR